MELPTESHWRRLPVSKDPAHLQRVIERIHPGKCSIDGSLGLRVGYLVCLAA
jgi:hypothetical protein